MDELTFENLKDKIIAGIDKKVPQIQCPICKKSHLTAVDGFFAHDLQSSLGSRMIGGKNIPTIPIVCTNCGYVMEFTAGSLGLLPQPPQTGNK